MLSASARKSKVLAGDKKRKGASAAASSAAAAMAAVASPAHSLGRGFVSTPVTCNVSRGRGAALGVDPAIRRPSASIGDGFGGDSFNPASTNTGFPFPPSPSTVWWDSTGGDPISPSYMRSTAWDPSWDKDIRPPNGFMSYFGNQPHNFHFVGAPVHNIEESSPTEVQILSEQDVEQVDSDNENARTEKRCLWTEPENVSLMSSWIEKSTDSTCGADSGGNQY